MISKLSRYWLKSDKPRILVQHAKYQNNYYDATGYKLFDAALVVLTMHVKWWGIDDPEALEALKEKDGDKALSFLFTRSNQGHEYESIDVVELIDPCEEL